MTTSGNGFSRLPAECCGLHYTEETTRGNSLFLAAVRV